VKDGIVGSLPMNGLVAPSASASLEAQALLDLDYVEDSAAQVDFNVVMTDEGRFVELQGTARAAPSTAR